MTQYRMTTRRRLRRLRREMRLRRDLAHPAIAYLGAAILILLTVAAVAYALMMGPA